MSFGFSVGDFIKTVELVGESGVAKTKFRELLYELYALETALLCIKELAPESGQNAEYLALTQAAAQCQHSVGAFWRLEGSTSRLKCS